MTERQVSPVEHDRTRSVVKYHVWNLTRNDRTLEAQRPVSLAAAFSHLRSVEIERIVFKERGHVACIT